MSDAVNQQSSNAKVRGVADIMFCIDNSGSRSIPHHVCVTANCCLFTMSSSAHNTQHSWLQELVWTKNAQFFLNLG